ncbi:MAG: DUF402 domain-containing protein [Dehalococcoidia bacterium]
MRITETKRHLDGSEHQFECELVLRRPDIVVVRFDHWEGRSAGGFDIPRGSRTDGFFWRRRHYSLYRMTGPDARPIADRFDIVEDVRFEESEVSYLDLLVDVWVAPDGTVLVEDEDEVEDHLARGLLSQAQRDRIERTAALLKRQHRRIIYEAARLRK